MSEFSWSVCYYVRNQKNWTNDKENHTLTEAKRRQNNNCKSSSLINPQSGGLWDNVHFRYWLIKYSKATAYTQAAGINMRFISRVPYTGVHLSGINQFTESDQNIIRVQTKLSYIINQDCVSRYWKRQLSCAHVFFLSWQIEWLQVVTSNFRKRITCGQWIMGCCFFQKTYVSCGWYNTVWLLSISTTHFVCSSISEADKKEKYHL